MKTTLLLLAALAAPVLADEEIIPAARGKERFEGMATKSPFVLATPPEAPKVETKSIFDNMFVKGIGTDYVIIQRVGDDQTMRFWGQTPNDEQIQVKEIRWSEQAGGTTVVMKKGAEEKEIGFNQNELRNPTPPPTGQRPPGAAFQTGMKPGAGPYSKPAPMSYPKPGGVPHPVPATHGPGTHGAPKHPGPITGPSKMSVTGPDRIKVINP